MKSLLLLIMGEIYTGNINDVADSTICIGSYDAGRILLFGAGKTIYHKFTYICTEFLVTFTF